MAKEREGRFSTMPLIVMDGGTPSAENINRWRDFVKRESKGDAHPTLDAIFDCALLGADKARDIDKEVNRVLKAKLRELATAIGRK
jgi:hypothetical protein